MGRRDDERIARLRDELERLGHQLEVATAALDRERWRFAQFVLAAPEAFLVSDRDGHIRVANAAAAHLLRTSADRLTGSVLLDRVAPRDRPALHRRLQALTTQGATLRFAVQVRGHRSVDVTAVVALDELPEGSELWWQLHDATWEPDAGTTRQSVGVRGSEPERNGDEGRWKDAFLLAAAHDLRSPFAIIRMLAQTLISRTELGLQTSLVEQVDEQAKRGLRLLNGLLDLSRFANGRVPLTRVPTDLHGLVERVRDDLDSASHPVHVVVDAVSVPIDPERTSQIVANLLGNAFEHTPPGTPVHIHVHRADSVLRLVVEDEGPGVPDDLKPDVFAPFVTRRAHACDHGGTGVGLALVQLFAELHGGRALVEDRPGGGARFVVELGVPGDAGLSGNGSA